MYGRHGEAPLPIVAAADAERLLRRRHRGGPPRRQVPHAGDPALRRLPRQRLPSRGASPTSTALPDIGVPFATEPNHADADGARRSGRTCATPRRWPGRGPSPARPASSTASAASRRRTAPATSPTTRRNHEHMIRLAGRQDRRHRRATSRRSRSTTTGRRRGARARLGHRPTGSIQAAVRRRARRRQAGGPRPPAPPQPVPGQPGRGAAPLPARCSSPR